MNLWWDFLIWCVFLTWCAQVAIRFGYNDRLDAVMAIAVGSATQLALAVLPIGVLLNWACGGNLRACL